jgi:PPOX class probable F420-dependent enzyme
MLNDVQAKLLTEPNTAIVTTLRADGSAHSTLTWIDWDGEYVVVNTMVGRAKERHLRRDNRITVTVLDRNDVSKYISLEGRAELTTEGAFEQVNRLSQRYRGTEFVLSAEMERIIARFRPERVYGVYDDATERELLRASGRDVD